MGNLFIGSQQKSPLKSSLLQPIPYFYSLILSYCLNFNHFIMKKTFTLFLSAISFLAAAQVDLSDGLVAHYPLDGNTNDYSGNNYDLTATDVTPVNDKSGNTAGAYSFNGTSSKMQTSTPPDFGGSHSISVSLWTKSNASNGIKYILYCNNFGLATNGPSANMVVSIPGTNAASWVITQNEWTHLTGYLRWNRY
jgi:hypothetical protein